MLAQPYLPSLLIQQTYLQVVGVSLEKGLRSQMSSDESLEVEASLAHLASATKEFHLRDKIKKYLHVIYKKLHDSLSFVLKVELK